MALRRVGAAGKGKQKELTEEQKQEIKEAFDLFDTDGSVSGFDGFGGDIQKRVRTGSESW